MFLQRLRSKEGRVSREFNQLDANPDKASSKASQATKINNLPQGCLEIEKRIGLINKGIKILRETLMRGKDLDTLTNKIEYFPDLGLKYAEEYFPYIPGITNMENGLKKAMTLSRGFFGRDTTQEKLAPFCRRSGIF